MPKRTTRTIPPLKSRVTARLLIPDPAQRAREVRCLVEGGTMAETEGTMTVVAAPRARDLFGQRPLLGSAAKGVHQTRGRRLAPEK